MYLVVLAPKAPCGSCPSESLSLHSRGTMQTMPMAHGAQRRLMLPIRLHRLPGGSRHFEADLARLFSRRNGFVFIGGLKPRDSPEGNLEQEVSDAPAARKHEIEPIPSIHPSAFQCSVHPHILAHHHRGTESGSPSNCCSVAGFDTFSPRARRSQCAYQLRRANATPCTPPLVMASIGH